ncbi:hypothetical protein [Streptomyces sp. NPDC002690]
MNALPPVPGPPSMPVPDPRGRNIVGDYGGMHALVADLVLPRGASMYVMSAMETSRELIRHSYYRIEFATVAVTHSLYALEQVLAERLPGGVPGSDDSLQSLIRRATDAGIVTAGLATELDSGRLLRDRLARGAASSAALGQAQAVATVRAVFHAVSLLLPPPPAAEATAAPAGGAQPAGALTGLWEEHLRAPFPDGFRGVDLAGVDLVLLDADVAGLVGRELKGGLDGTGIASLWGCIADLDEEYCASYFTKLRTMAGVVASLHTPTAI